MTKDGFCSKKKRQSLFRNGTFAVCRKQTWEDAPLRIFWASRLLSESAVARIKEVGDIAFETTIHALRTSGETDLRPGAFFQMYELQEGNKPALLIFGDLGNTDTIDPGTASRCAFNAGEKNARLHQTGRDSSFVTRDPGRNLWGGGIFGTRIGVAISALPEHGDEFFSALFLCLLDLDAGFTGEMGLGRLQTNHNPLAPQFVAVLSAASSV